MAELVARTPCAGLLPVTVGRLKLSEADLGPLATLAPLAGQDAPLSQAMQAAHGLAFPEPNRSTQAGGVRAIWFGRGMALLMGAVPDAQLAERAAITDQSDGWAAVRLAGPGAEDALARLVPVDLRATAFPAGRTCRTLLGHMHASITRETEDVFLILVFRSMAQTLVDEVQEAMEALAARG